MFAKLLLVMRLTFSQSIEIAAELQLLDATEELEFGFESWNARIPTG